MVLLDSIDSLYHKYNVLLEENGYNEKYELGNAIMFIIEGMDKVHTVIEKNRKQKLTKHKKLPGNTIIEIDNCSPLDILKLQKNPMTIAEGEGIGSVYGKGKKKSEIQQVYEELNVCGSKLMEYKECFEFMKKERNSYSKTDLEAAFNVPIAVENYFIVHAYVSNDRTDYNTLIPVVQKHIHAFGGALKEATATVDIIARKISRKYSEQKRYPEPSNPIHSNRGALWRHQRE